MSWFSIAAPSIDCAPSWPTTKPNLPRSTLDSSRNLQASRASTPSRCSNTLTGSGSPDAWEMKDLSYDPLFHGETRPSLALRNSLFDRLLRAAWLDFLLGKLHL